jgi:hypothetical protein
MALIDLKNVTMVIKDNGANEVEIKIGEGQMRYTEKKTRIYRKDRGLLDEVVNGDEEPMDVVFDLQWEYIKASSGGTPTIEDALKQRGEASAWVSTDDDLCAPYCVDIELHNAVPCGDDEDEVILLEHFRWEQLDHDLRGATIACTGKCNKVEATVTRQAGA